VTTPPATRDPVDDADEPSYPQERTPPQDTAAEQSVLGGMLLSKEAVGDVVEILRSGDFYRPAHATIFDVIVDLFGKGEPADPITVVAALQNAGNLTRVGGGNYIHDLIAAVPTASNAAWYARSVADTALRRRVIDACTRGIQYGYGPGDAADVVDRAQQAVYDVTERRSGDDFEVLADLLQPALDEIEAVGQRDGSMRGVPSGFADLDRLLNGFQAGQMIIVAGRPATGKTTLATDFGRAAAVKRDIPAAMFSLEMSKVELTTRILSAEARVPLNTLRSGQLSDDDWTKMARRMAEINDAPFFIDDTANMTMMEIRAKARRLCQRHGVKLIVVDYLQLMTGTKRAENREKEIAEISRGLKLLAKELEVPVIAVAQLNREAEKRQDHRPQLSDLRDSGSLEQDADVVILVHRDGYYDKESPRAGEADLIVAKHRSGPTDTITVAAQLHFSRFVDMAIN
jgi:replicative DNA helicase